MQLASTNSPELRQDINAIFRVLVDIVGGRGTTVPTISITDAANGPVVDLDTMPLVNELRAAVGDFITMVATGNYLQANAQARLYMTGDVASVNTTLVSARQVSDMARSQKDILEKLAHYKSAEMTWKQITDLRVENEVLKKSGKSNNSFSGNLRTGSEAMDRRLHELEKTELRYEKLKDEYDIMYGRYEMLRLQYARIRTHKMQPTPPNFVAGRSHPYRPDQKFITNLSKLRDTEKAVKESNQEQKNAYDDEGDDDDTDSSVDRINAALFKTRP